MKLRNRKAKELGYKNYAEMILEITELGAEWFHSFVKTIDEATLIPYQDLLTNIKADESETDIGMADSRKLMLQYSMMYVSYPLYVQNYLIADIISRQVHKTLEEKFGKDYVFNKEVGPYLAETLWKDGESLHWQARLVEATGKELDIKGYLKAHGL